MSFLIRRGQSVRWRMTMLSGEQPTNMAGGTWGVQETSFIQLPSFEQGETEAWLVWSSAQTTAMRVGTKRLRLKYTQANGGVKVFPDLRISVE